VLSRRAGERKDATGHSGPGPWSPSYLEAALPGLILLATWVTGEVRALGLKASFGSNILSGQPGAQRTWRGQDEGVGRVGRHS
jgi:hypothetical protein